MLRHDQQRGHALLVQVCQQLVELDRHGISPGYAREMSAAGFGKMEELIELDRHGISPGSVAKLKKVGYELAMHDVIELDRYGVSADFAVFGI